MTVASRRLSDGLVDSQEASRRASRLRLLLGGPLGFIRCAEVSPRNSKIFNSSSHSTLGGAYHAKLMRSISLRNSSACVNISRPPRDSKRQIAIEYTSSPLEHPGTQILTDAAMCWSSIKRGKHCEPTRRTSRDPGKTRSRESAGHGPA